MPISEDEFNDMEEYKNKYEEVRDVLKDNPQKAFYIKELMDITGLSRPGVGHHVDKLLEEERITKKKTSPEDIKGLRVFVKWNGFKCEECGKEFGSKRGLSVHKSQVHE